MNTKKGNPLLSVRLPADLDQQLNDHIELTGGSRSTITIDALRLFLNPPAPEDELDQLKQQIQSLEGSMQQLWSTVNKASVH